MSMRVSSLSLSRRTLPARFRSAWPSDERGSVTVMVAVTMTGLIALLALGIDIGALFNARSEAQRAADAAALAGASAFLDFDQTNVRSVATQRAVEFAVSNQIRGAPIAPEDVTVTVNVDSSTVRAHIRRDGVPTWFARIFGVDAVDVGAEATAWAGEAGAAQCLKPFAVPDLWHERTHDLNQNRIWDEDERWRYDPASGDRYLQFSGPGSSPDETGYGSRWRDGFADAQGRTYQRDYGRRITIKVTDPSQTWNPSFFLPWVVPMDGSQQTCGAGPGPQGPGGGGGGNTEDPGDGNTQGPGDGEGGGQGWFRWQERRGDLGGSAGPPPGGGPGNRPGGGVDRDGGQGRGAARYRQNICSCNNSVVDLDTEYMIEPGNMVGPTHQGVSALISRDPDAYWDERSNTLVSQYGMDSPRVVTVAFFHPEEASRPGRHYIRFNNFGRMFIEEQASPQDPVTARFLGYARGVGPAGRDDQTTGSLVRVLQLIR
jgi:hypothetical protein